MWIVAVGWGYVVILMAATESSVIAGIMTFFGYGVLPLSLLFYVTGTGRRRARRAAAARAAVPPARPPDAPPDATRDTPGAALDASTTPQP